MDKTMMDNGLVVLTPFNRGAIEKRRKKRRWLLEAFFLILIKIINYGRRRRPIFTHTCISRVLASLCLALLDIVERRKEGE